ncbi:MAG: helix-turn-helix domain-containing protein [Clostridiales bacterium]|nr:helix-turn-helix domain-containing protein [Clostridiales bacterium]
MVTDTGINSRFKQIRLMLNMSQEEFGKSIGLSKSGVSNIENGERGLRDTYISIICNTFHINSQWFRTGIGDMLPPEPSLPRSAFDSYIKSLGYTVDPCVSEKTQEALIELSKGGVRVRFTQEEFEQFQRNIADSAEYHIWKQQRK